MTHRDVDTLRRCLISLQRSTRRIAEHVDDLHCLAYEPATRNTEPDRAGFESRPPPGWKVEPGHAQQLLATLTRVIVNSEAAIVELEREMFAVFFAGSRQPEPSRGVLITAEEHEQQLRRQKVRREAGQYTSARLVEQPRNELGKR